MTPIEHPNFHVPPPILERDFELGCMNQLSYTREDISKAVIDNINRLRRDDLSSRQAEAIQRMKYHGTINMIHPENYDDLWKWFGIYNDLFFGGLLKGFVQIEIFMQKYTRERIFGLCEGYSRVTHPGEVLGPRFRKEKVEVLIAICDRDNLDSNAKQRLGYLNPFKRVKLYQETLLHEMLHALFGIYECNCDDCFTVSNGGHDRYWQAAAERVENSGCLGWHPKLGRMIGLIEDLARDTTYQMTLYSAR